MLVLTIVFLCFDVKYSHRYFDKCALDCVAWACTCYIAYAQFRLMRGKKITKKCTKYLTDFGSAENAHTYQKLLLDMPI